MSNNIVVVHLNMRFGGVEKQLLNWINHVKCKHEIILVLCKKEGELLNQIHPCIKILEVGSYPKFRLDLIWTLKFYNIIKKFRPRIIYSCHGTFNWMVVLLKNENRKIVLSHPGYLNKGKLFYLKKFFFNRADLVIPVSDYIESLFRNIWHVKNTFVIENTTDIKPSDYFKDNKRSVYKIISCSRIDRNKNIYGIIEALSILKKKGYKFEYIVLGEGQDLNRCINLSKELGLNSSIHFMGYQNNPSSFIIDSDLLILNSSTEALPTVIPEAWALRTLVLTNNYLGRDDGFIKDGFNGFVIYNNDSINLALKIISIIELDKGDKETITQNAFEKYEKNNSHVEYVSKYEKLFCT